MEGEVRKYRERQARVQRGLVIQEQPIFQNMQHNQVPESDRRRLSLENLPGLYNLSCSQLLALANNTLGTSSSVGASPSSQYLMDFWIDSSSMESNPLISNPGSSLGINTGIPGERTMQTPQHDVPTPQKFLCDLNLTPEEMVSTSFQPTEPEIPPVTLDTPGTRLSETDQKPHDPIKKSILETGSPSGVKRRKRPRIDENAQLKTPASKRKKIRPKVVREAKTNEASSKSGIKKPSVSAATATKPSEESSYIRPKRSRKRSVRLDFDLQDEDQEYCGLDFPSEYRTGGEGPTLGLFGSIPKGRRKKRIHANKRQQKINPSSERGNDCLSSTLSLVNTGPAAFSESEEDIASNSHIYQSLGRKRSRLVTIPRNFGSLAKLLESIVPSKCSLPLLNVSEIQPKVPRKKRRQRDPLASQLNARILHREWQSPKPKVTSFAEMWIRSMELDSVTKKLQELDINKKFQESALVLYQTLYEEQRVLIKYSKKQLPKVDIDPETNRVFKLLMSSINNDGVDGLDEDKRKWWKDERNVFHERANSFIARMSIVQGDRTFSRWKGSVVDSVVGVFLTQNVADHSSSSAYMDLAAEFPVNWNFNKRSSLEEWGSSATSNPRIRKSTCVIIEEIDDDDDEDGTDAVCAHESSKTSDSSMSSTNQSTMTLLDPSAGTSTSSHCELNLNEVPHEVENCDVDALTNKFYEEIQVQHMSSHQQELDSTLQAQDQEKNTRKEVVKNKEKKKPTTSRPVGRPPKNKVKESKKKSKKPAKSKLEDSFDWDSLRKQVESGGKKRERTERTLDTVDWDALRGSSVNKIAAIIIKRGMNNMLAKRIKDFLNRLVEEHGSIDLEWLRDVPPDKAKEYLLSINGLGLKSVECVRLLSLHQIAFPVDTNVGRIAVRLGWVPLQPLPDQLQMHLLELYPVLNSVQKYLWPRLCKLDQKTLYELHYHMITFGKVFCTKLKPNCKACPMKAECRHYASAQRARLALPEPEVSDRTTVMLYERRYKRNPFVVNFRPSLLFSQENEQEAQRCEPIIEEPASPEPEYTMPDIEDYPWDNNNVAMSTILENDPWEDKDIIPTIMLNKEAVTSTDLVVLSTQAAAIPTRKLKIMEKLRTEHLVYELPDYHSILQGFERREDEDIVPYLLAIWTPGETENSIQLPKQRCEFQGDNSTLCHEKKCFECNKIREEQSQIVRGTILVSYYFQENLSVK
ncbi:hypothetical protein CARUB_v10012825mg [Capsella rubella]|uniref:HhH-GPD domain-containing protein n=1 Tax=Capsella rubella TaxID=81985 RepID=R0G2D6_9BRAS|nr:hypothetical protein CARUB_v10012825mg [Capsella rubella]